MAADSVRQWVSLVLAAGCIVVGLGRDEAALLTIGFGAMSTPGMLNLVFHSKIADVEVHRE